MTKTIYVLPVLLVAGLHAAPAANALTLDNGRNLNGLSFNGTEREGFVSGNAGQATTIILKDGEHVTLR